MQNENQNIYRSHLSFGSLFHVLSLLVPRRQQVQNHQKLVGRFIPIIVLVAISLFEVAKFFMAYAKISVWIVLSLMAALIFFLPVFVWQMFLIEFKGLK